MAGVRGLEPPDVISTIFVVAARGRSVSSPTISADQREFPQLFQPFRENDICEFESSHPHEWLCRSRRARLHRISRVKKFLRPARLLRVAHQRLAKTEELMALPGPLSRMVIALKYWNGVDDIAVTQFSQSAVCGRARNCQFEIPAGKDTCRGRLVAAPSVRARRERHSGRPPTRPPMQAR